MSEFGCQLYKEDPTADFSQDQITCLRRVLFKDVCVCVCVCVCVVCVRARVCDLSVAA